MNPETQTPNTDGTAAAATPGANVTPSSSGTDEQASTEPVSREKYNQAIADRDDARSRQGDFTKADQLRRKGDKEIVKFKEKEIASAARIDELEQQILDIYEGNEAVSDQTYSNLKKKLVEEKRQNRKDRDAFKKEKEEHAEDLAKARTSDAEKIVRKVAEEKGVDAKELQKRVTEDEVTDRIEIERLARYVPAANADDEPPEPGKPSSDKPPLLRGSPKGSGVSEPSREQETKNMFPNS